MQKSTFELVLSETVNLTSVCCIFNAYSESKNTRLRLCLLKIDTKSTNKNMLPLLHFYSPIFYPVFKGQFYPSYCSLTFSAQSSLFPAGFLIIWPFTLLLITFYGHYVQYLSLLFSLSYVSFESFYLPILHSRKLYTI